MRLSSAFKVLPLGHRRGGAELQPTPPLPAGEVSSLEGDARGGINPAHWKPGDHGLSAAEGKQPENTADKPLAPAPPER